MVDRTLELLINLRILGENELRRLRDQLEALETLAALDIDLGDSQAQIDALRDEIASLADELEQVASTSPTIPNLPAPQPAVVVPDGAVPEEDPAPTQTPDAISDLASALGIAREEAEQLAGAIGQPADEVETLISRLEQLENLDLGIDDQFTAIARSANLTRDQFEELRRAADLGDVAAEARELAQALDISEDQARELREELSDVARQELRQRTGGRATPRTARTGSAGRAGGNVFGRARDAINNNPLGGIDVDTGAVTASLGQVASAVFLIRSAYEGLVATAIPAYQALIASNERLQQDILQSAAGIVSTSDVLAGGVQIEDSTQAIQALQGPIESSIRRVEEATRSLVGVTSEQTTTVFNTILRNVGILNTQLEAANGEGQAFANSIEAAESLVPGLVAALGTFGLPLEQAADEVNNLLQGTIDNTAQLARSLGISREQVELWKEQGSLVDNLVQRFEPLVAANALAAQSISGVTSNIQDVIEVVSRTSGQPLLQPIVEQLQELETLLNDNIQPLTQFFTFFSTGLLQAASGIGEELAPSIEALGPLLIELGESSQAIFTLVANGAQAAAAGLEPTLTAVIRISTEALRAINLLNRIATQRQRADSLEALEVLAGATRQLGDEAISTAERLKSLGELETAGTITGEQQQELDNLRASALNLVPALDQQIRALQEVNAIGSEAQNIQAAQVAELERLREAYINSGLGIDIQSRRLGDLGSSTDQVARRLESARRIIAQEGGGDRGAFNEAVQQIQELTGLALEQGQITREQAAAELQTIVDNADTSVESRREAQEEINRIREQGLNQFVQDQEAEIALLEATASQGGEAAIAAQEEIGRRQEEILNDRIRTTQQSIEAEEAALEGGNGSVTRLAELEAQERELQASRVQIAQNTARAIADAENAISTARQSSIQDQIRDTERLARLGQQDNITNIQETTRLRQQEIDEQISQVRNQIETERRLISEGTGSETRLAELTAQEAELADRRVDAAIDANERIQQERLAAEQRTATQRQAIEADAALAQAEAEEQGLVTDAQIEEQRLQLTEQRIERELQAELRRQAILREAPPTAENLDAIAQSENQVTQLRTEASNARREITVAAERRAVEQVERIRREAETQLTQSTAQTEAAIAQAETEARAAGAAEVDVRRETQRRTVLLERETAQERLRIAQENLAALEALPDPLDPDDARERARQVADAQTEVYNATGQALRAQAAVEQDVADQAIANIERQAQARQTAEQAAISALERRQQLLQTEQDLQSSVVNLEVTRLQNRARLTEDPRRRAQIELEIARTQQNAQRERFDFERQLLELTLQREAIENRIAQAQLRGELARARAERATPEEIAAIEQQLADRQALGNLIAQSADSRRQVLRNQQAGEADTARTDVRLAARGVAESLREAGDAIKESAQEVADSLRGATRDEIEAEDFARLSVEDQQRLSQGFALGESVEDRQRAAQGFRPGESVEDRQDRLAAGVPDEVPEEDKTPEEATADNTAQIADQTLRVEEAIREQTDALTGKLDETAEVEAGAEVIAGADPNTGLTEERTTELEALAEVFRETPQALTNAQIDAVKAFQDSRSTGTSFEENLAIRESRRGEFRELTRVLAAQNGLIVDELGTVIGEATAEQQAEALAGILPTLTPTAGERNQGIDAQIAAAQVDDRTNREADRQSFQEAVNELGQAAGNIVELGEAGPSVQAAAEAANAAEAAQNSAEALTEAQQSTEDRLADRVEGQAQQVTVSTEGAEEETPRPNTPLGRIAEDVEAIRGTLIEQIAFEREQEAEERARGAEVLTPAGQDATPEQATREQDAAQQQVDKLEEVRGEVSALATATEQAQQQEQAAEAQEPQVETVDQQAVRALIERVSPEEAIAREGGLIERLQANIDNAPSNEEREALLAERESLEAQARAGTLSAEGNVRLTDVIGELSRSITETERAEIQREISDRQEVQSRLEEGGNQQDVRNLRDLFLERAGIERGSREDRSLTFVQDEQTLFERGAAFQREEDSLAAQQARSNEAAEQQRGPELTESLLNVEVDNSESVESIESQSTVIEEQTQAIQEQTNELVEAIREIPRPKQFKLGTNGEAATPVGEGFTVAENGPELVTDPTTGKTQLFTGESFIQSDKPLIVKTAAETREALRTPRATPILQPLPTPAEVYGVAVPAMPAASNVTVINQNDPAMMAVAANGQQQLKAMQAMQKQLQNLDRIFKATDATARGLQSTNAGIELIPEALNDASRKNLAIMRQTMRRSYGYLG